MEFLPTNMVGYIPICCVLYLFYSILRFGRRESGLPPGPPTIPILGNAHLIPAHRVDRKFKEWSDKYGGIFSLKIGVGTMIVITDRRAIHDLFGKKSSIYADRPMDQNISIATGNQNFGFLPADAPWRAMRKIASQNLSPKRLDEKVAPIQEAEIRQFAHDMLKNPEQFDLHVNRVTSSVAGIIIFGHRAPTIDSWWATCVKRVMMHVGVALKPGSYFPIEQFPILNYVPDRWVPSKVRARRTFEFGRAIWMEARQRVIDRRANGDKRISLADQILSEEVKPDVQLNAAEVSNFFGALYTGAADTSHNMIMTNILFLAKHSWVQEKARVELDRVCGTERTPAWKDFNELPYINCIVKEGLRIRPTAPTGIPHSNKVEDWYDGYRIPKGSTIFIPSWGVHQTHYEDPETYNPDRYLNHPRLSNYYSDSPDYANRDHYAYGVGRRICVGIHLAERTQWRIVAMLLWAFKIEPAIDEETGEQIELDLDNYTDELLIKPSPFRVKITPRSEKHAELIREGYRDVEEYLREWT